MIDSNILKKKIKVAKTRSGVPCLWESLTRFDKINRSTIILDAKGCSKKAYYYNAEREKQALVSVIPGDYVVKCFEDQHGLAISIFRVEEIFPEDSTATIYPVYRKSSLVEETSYPSKYSNMIELCASKLTNGQKIIAHKEYDTQKAV